MSTATYCFWKVNEFVPSQVQVSKAVALPNLGRQCNLLIVREGEPIVGQPAAYVYVPFQRELTFPLGLESRQ